MKQQAGGKEGHDKEPRIGRVYLFAKGDKSQKGHRLDSEKERDSAKGGEKDLKDGTNDWQGGKPI